MKFFLISDSTDTAIGLRLAGIEGVVVSEPAEVDAALDRAIADEEVGVVLITSRLSELCEERVRQLKQTLSRPLISQIPDQGSQGSVGDSITRYVREAVGIKI